MVRTFALGLLLCAATTAGVIPVGADVPLPTVPGPPTPASPVGSQPGTPAPSCSFPPLSSAQMVQVFADPWTKATSAGVPVIDPANPCHIYRWHMDLYGYETIQRGDFVNGTTAWQPVYDAAPALNGNAGWVPALKAPGAGRVIVVTSGTPSTPHAAASSDQGASWSAIDAGLPPATVASDAVGLLAVAPSDHDVMVLDWPGDGLLHLSTDAGRHWSLMVLPASVAGSPLLRDVEFDPADARHVFVLADLREFTSQTDSLLLESRDQGAHWTATRLSGDQAMSRQLLVTTRAVYLGALDSSGAATAWWRRTAGVRATATWSQVVPAMPGAMLAADAANPATLVWAALPAPNQLVVSATTDDFATAPRLIRRFTAPAGTMYAATDMTPDSLAVDRQGDVFLSRRLHLTDGSGLWSDDLVAFRVAAPAPGGGAASQGEASAPPPQPPPPSQPAPPPLPFSRDLATCSLASFAVPVDPTSSSSTKGTYEAGSLTFDGRFLDYTQEGLAPGVIFRMTPSCVAAPSIRLRPADFPNGQLPILYDLSYAPDLRLSSGRTGVILAAALHGSDARLLTNQVPVYAVDPVTGEATLLFGLSIGEGTDGTSRDGSPGDPLFAYDIFKQGLWTLDSAGAASGNVLPGLLPMAGGPFQLNCMTNFMDINVGFGGLDTAFHSTTFETSTWTVGGDGIMYVATEDDRSVVMVDSRSCQALAGFQHRTNSESPSENDQLACDAITYGPGSSGAAGGPGYSVLWIRDSSPNTVSAYRIPTGYCPFPSTMAYTGATSAAQGQTLSLCFVLKSMSAGEQAPLANQPVDVSFNGASVGSGTTDSGGRICRPAVAANAGAIAAAARFAGNNAYLPAGAAATVVVPAGAPHIPNGALAAVPLAAPGGLPGPPPGGGTTVGSAPGTSTAVQSEAQAQVQSQAQAQSAAQAHPGVAMQRQKRTQIATQEQNTATQSSLQASRVRRTRAAPVAALGPVVAAALLGLGAVRRRPRVAPARAERRRRA